MSIRMRSVLALGAGLLAAGCNPISDSNRSAVLLRSDFKATGTGDTALAGLYSDVVNSDGTTSDDIVEIEITSTQKNPTGQLSDLYAVIIEGVTVQWSRPDGKNVPGVDVPFPVTYALSATVKPGAVGTVEMILVTKEMKLQAPLRTLWFGNGQRIFATATATVFGHDQVQNAVQTSASMVVVFSDLLEPGTSYLVSPVVRV